MDNKARLTKILRDLFASQKLAVLGTQSEGQPYNCLVAFACTEDFRHLMFATKRETRKYKEIKAEPRVAFLVDNRANRESDFRNATAVTATGKAKELKGAEKKSLLNIYLAKHPQLMDFVDSPDNALIVVKIKDYVISSFREVKTLRL